MYLHESTFRVDSHNISSNLALAWTILLKDYLGSLDVSFLYTDSTRSDGAIKCAKRAQIVDANITASTTLSQLRLQIGQQTHITAEEQPWSNSTMRTHLHISNGGVDLAQQDEELSTLFPAVDLDITCTISKSSEEIHLYMTSPSRLSSIKFPRLLRQFEEVIQQVQHPSVEDAHVCNIKTASETDVREIWERNQNVPDAPQTTALEAFSNHVKNQPDALAVSAWDGELTYGELDRLSTILSLQLVQGGVCQDIIVPLCFEKSMWTLVAVFAVVKTGAAFVLFDEDLPHERLKQLAAIIEHETILVLASSTQRHRASLLTDNVITVDSRLTEIEEVSSITVSSVKITPSSLIYLVFTSGTTGVPKAVMIQHSNICAFASSLRPLRAVTTSSRIIALSSYAWDVSLADIFLSLLSGACICVPSSWECKNDITKLFNRYRITHIETTTSISRLISPQESPTLETLDIGGEQVTEDALIRWRGSGIRVINSYGPAEGTVVTVANDDILNSAKPSIIGKSLGISWIMDPLDQWRLTPIGGIGELVLEGPLVGAGYLHNNEATQAAFFDNPQWLLDGLSGNYPGRCGRVYRTGDLVRYTEEGLLEYIGRRDTQIKIRGQRIELSELAVHIQRLIPPSIEWCIEFATLKTGAKAIVVFLVPTFRSVENSSSLLRSTVTLVDTELRNTLPVAMIPGAYAAIDRIPINLTGKTDHNKLKHIASTLTTDRLIFPNVGSSSHVPCDACHKAQAPHSVPNGFHADTTSARSSVNGEHPEPNGVHSDNGSTPVAARKTVKVNGVENGNSVDKKFTTLSQLWADVLGVQHDQIHPSDTFFEHGGESLKAIKLVGAAARVGMQLDVATIFKHPRLSELASRCKLIHASTTDTPKPFSLLQNKSVLMEAAMCCGSSIDEIEDAYPCTPMQEGLITSEYQRSASYVGRGVLPLPRGIDADRLSQAWKRVASNYPILRTRIIETDSHGFLQVVLKDSTLSHGQYTNLASCLKDEERKKMMVGSPLCRWAVVREALTTYFVLTMHHAIYDGWILPRIGAEVFKAYQGVRLQPTLGFNMFIRHLKELHVESAQKYWKQQLADSHNTSFFPTIPYTIQEPKADSTVLKTFPVPANNIPGVSTPSLLRAAWALLVATLSGSDDVTFGMTVSGRNAPIVGIEDLLSPTISTIPVRIKLDGSEITRDFVTRVQTEAMESTPFENMGLQNIRKIDSTTRSGSNFQTLLIIHPPDTAPSESLPDIGPTQQELKTMLENLDISTSLSDFNEYGLMVLVTQTGNDLLVEASYDARVIYQAEATLLLDQFAHVVHQMSQKGSLEEVPRTLSLASDTDLETIWGWNAKCPEGVQECIQERIARIILTQPEAEAICAWDGNVTYDELDRLSSRLAQHLLDQGVRPGSLVPICMEKSKWATIAMLGIMRTGAGFVSMDVRQQPEQRLRKIVEETKARWIVTAGPAAAIAHRLSEGVINCNRLWERTRSDTLPPSPLDTRSLPSDTAFVVFTSGSTGTPKGIPITHEAFCTTIKYHECELQLSSDCRIYDYASYSFDIAVHNSLMALAFGGCLCVPSEDDRENDIDGSFERLNANWADLTPSVARLIDPVAVPSLKTLILSGEAMARDIVTQWASRVNLINAYGPAEAQICTVQRQVQSHEDVARIGRAVGCSTWIIDPESATLSPIGAVGELLIEGSIISPGYLNAPCDPFIKDPVWLLRGSGNIPGRSGDLYRTGDLVRYEHDGSIQYIGRATTQLKIRGQRVELDDVEYHLREALPESHGAVADVIEFDGISALCAFIVRKQESSDFGEKNSMKAGGDLFMELIASPTGLEDKLKALLPSYMVPTIFFSMSHIPLSTTRKIDRVKLKKTAASFSREEFLALNHQEETVDDRELTSKQQTMAEIWSQTLKLDTTQFSPKSEFFQLGGDSITAMRLVKVGRKHGLSFTVADVFRSSHFEQLCAIATECLAENDLPSFSEKIMPFALIEDGDKDALTQSAAAACEVHLNAVLDVYSCSPFQEGVFTETTIDQTAYVQQIVIKLDANLDLERVLSAWESAIELNPMLRTRIFQSEQASLMQVVLRKSHEWKWYDSVKDYHHAIAETPIVLGSPLCRFGLVKAVEDSVTSYSMVWTMHHAIYDGWSVDLILRQVTNLYHGQHDIDVGPGYNLFVRFLSNQREKSEEWWRSTLSGSSSAAVFPKAPMTNKEMLTSSSTLYKDINPPKTLPPGYTAAALLRSAWAIVMARHTGGESVLFGEVRLGRNISIHGVERMRGPTISSVPVLVHVDRNQTIQSLLYNVRERDIQMQDFDHFGLQNIASISEDTRAACNFQSILVLREQQNDAEEDLIFDIDSADDVRDFNSWNLMLIFHQKAHGIVVEALYRDSVISKGLVELLVHQLQSVFYGLCNLPVDTPLQKLDAVSDDDLAMIWRWNKNAPETIDKFMHEIVAEQASCTPDKLAIHAHDGQLTYKQLDDYSTNLASQLVAQGIGINHILPLVFEKSVWVTVAMLAVIKTGAAFSVMDVSYPETRLKDISTLIKAQTVLASTAQEQLAKRLADDVLVVDTLSCTKKDDTCYRRLDSVPRDTNRIMYVCFTSGSTGIPKGVMVAHRNLASACIAQTRDLGFYSDDRVYDFSSHAFDANIWHTWLALTVGACLCIPSQDDRIRNLAGSIDSFRSTKLFLTPSVARTINPQEVPTVKRLFLGGEAVTPLDVSMWRACLDLWCAYGPTETTPLCIFTPLLTPESASNIGRGSGVRPWVCDPQDFNKLLAVGAVGELLSEGPLVTHGYYHQPEKTAAVFIEDPEFLINGSVTQPGRHGRLYRTGDLVRYSFDGTIEYMGRADSQVKLRGQRVEFGEIQYHLKNAIPDASIICEVVPHPSSGYPLLVAFCATSSTSPDLDKDAARLYLSKRLPPYMIPEAFLTLPEMPTLPSGKVDRNRLKKLAPELLQLSFAQEASASTNLYGPLTKMEEQLRKLWATALNQEDIVLHLNSDFFDVGADSIAAMKLSNLARRHELSLTMGDIIRKPKLLSMALAVEPLQPIFDSPTPFSLIASNDRDDVVAKAAIACNVSSETIVDVYPCTPLQVELFALTMRQPHAYIRRSVFEVPSDLSFDRLLRAWKAVIKANPILRTRFVEFEGLGLSQTVMEDNAIETFDSLSTYLAIDSAIADLGTSLSKITAIVDEQAPKFVWTIHHALYDEWSVQIIQEQLRRAYRDQPIIPPPDFSLFVRYIQSQDLQVAKQFWQERLEGCAFSGIYPALPSSNYKVQPCKTFKRSLRTSVASHTNLQAACHAAWALVVSKISENDDIVFAATLSGRNAPVQGIEQMVGPIIAPVPVRVQLNRAEQTIQILLSCIDQANTSLAPYQHIGTKTIELINDDTKAACKFQTLIVVNPPGDEEGPEAIRISTYEVNGEEQEVFHTFGLVLFFTPTNGGLVLEVVYDPALLNEREIERLSGRLEAVLEVVAHQPKLSILDVDCLGQEDLEDILKWNCSVPPASKDLLHELVLTHAQRLKDKIAIDAWDCKITYAQVEELSSNFSRHLLKGLGSQNRIVPILASKSGYVPIAAIAVLRAGATFLPLDASQPISRLKAIVEQISPDLVISAKSSAESAMAFGVPLLVIEDCINNDGIVEEVISFDSQEILPEHVACILFTSGSTGVPKGVMQTHQALSSAITHQASKTGFKEETRAYDFASYSFDVSWNMIFKVLAVGGTLCVPSEVERQNDLVGGLNRSSATLTELTASVARIIDPAMLSTLETLILSGEFADTREFEQWRPKVQLIICYGPSECTSVSTSNRVSYVNNDGIGSATGCVTWLVDPQNHKQLMPVGAVGEILIDGPIVGKGYYNNEELTSAAYVSDMPWPAATVHREIDPSRRAFKSGDLARYDSRGKLHFLSRKDSQIKLHGQRIELEEVQHHVKLRVGELVGSVVCSAVKPPNSSEEVLATFLVNKTAALVNSCTFADPMPSTLAALSTLDRDLNLVLPRYMVPAAYYFITTVPRTTNGKVDRRKLTEIALQARLDQVHRGRPSHEVSRRAPATSAEVVMQRLWASALGLPADLIGADDDFFSLNGDSISAMKLVAAARGERYDLRVSDVFKTPQLSDMALKVQSLALENHSGKEDEPFALLGGPLDITATREEAALKCGLQDPNSIEDIYPCTPLQENMLAATIRDPGSFVSLRLYSIPQEVDLIGFQNAWSNVIARNRILRTRLVDIKNHGLTQVVIQQEPSWNEYPSIKAFVEDSQAENIGHGTRLSHWAVIKEPTETRLVWVIHHSVYDGWTLPMIEDEVIKSYYGLELPKPLPDMRPIIKYLREQDIATSTEFWNGELENGTEAAVFPPLPSHNYVPKPESYMETAMSADFSSLPPGVNVSALLYSSWSLLVSRLTGNEKIASGTILTGRDAPIDQVDKIIGPTITTVPFLVDVDWTLSLEDFTNQLQDKYIRMMPHEHFGINSIRRVSETCEAACGFQTVLVVQPSSAFKDTQFQREHKPIMEDLDESMIAEFPNQHTILSQYGLMMELLPSSSELSVRASFDSTLLTTSQVERLMNQWEHIIQQILKTIAQSPKTPLDQLKLICHKDLSKIWEWNRVVPESVDDVFIHNTVSELALLHPDVLAIDACDGQLTYKELDSVSSILAERLVRLGTGPGKFVPLFFRKSMWANVSMLAVLKAGGAFVPLDADHPEGRLRAVMQPLDPELILCSAQTRDRAAQLAPNTMIVDESLLDTSTEPNGISPTPSPPSNSQWTLQSKDLAYAVFTSGSTGAAKGVKISHSNLATAIRYQAGAEGLQNSSGSRVLDSSSYSFDACIFNFFYALAQGGCLCVPIEDSLKGDIGSFIHSSNVNWAQLVPSVARTINPDTVPGLQTLILTGEAITQGDINTWHSHVKLINVYGPTECTILCAISPQIVGLNQTGNIGTGKGANLWLTEIGNPNKLAAIGEVGEILIEGPLVGAGYLGPYEYPLIVDPPWLSAGATHINGRQGTLFRTGDQARYNDDGTLVFIGRIGSEVKLRGQRVDLMEVEDIVRHHDLFGLEYVADIIRLGWGEKANDKQILVLFVSDRVASRVDSTQSQGKLNTKLRLWVAELKTVLNTALPSYLHPEAFVALPSIPRTNSGKTDRRRLKDIGRQIRPQDLVMINASMTRTSSSLASTEQELLLAGLWADVLGIDSSSIAREDDFFLLGGDSLRVMRLTTVAHEHKLSLKASDVFKYPKLLQLALMLEDNQASSHEVVQYKPYSLVPDITDLEAFKKDYVEPALNVPTSHIEDIFPANGFQVDYINNAEEPLGLQYAYLDIAPETSWPKLVSACREVMQTFEGCRTRFVLHQGKYYQIVLRDAPLLVEELKTTEQITTFSKRFCPPDCREAGISDIYTKLSLVNTGGDFRRVILRLSHMQNDGWCTPRILEAIADAYNGREIERTPDWTRVLAYRQQTADSSRKYWRALLQDMTQTTPPLVFKPAESKARTLRTFALPNFYSSAENRRTRPTVVVNVAWALVLQQLAGHNDVVFGNVTTGRNGAMPGLDSVVGPCVNMLPVRFELNKNNTTSRKQMIRELIEASSNQIDERTAFEGLDWEDMTNNCTAWPSGTRQSSAVHFRNMAFEPELVLGMQRLIVAWYELVDTPHWTTVLVYPEDDFLRLWLLANPAEIGDEGADEILHMLSGFVNEVVAAIADDGVA